MMYFVTTEPIPALQDLCALRFAKVIDGQPVPVLGDELRRIIDRFDYVGASGLPKQGSEVFDDSFVDKGFVLISPRDSIAFHNSLWFLDEEGCLLHYIDDVSDRAFELHVNNVFYMGHRTITEFEYVEKEEDSEEE